jgi:hypothetical protein
MSGRLFLQLAWDERANASYFPVHELESAPEEEWVENYLLPVVRKIAARRAKAIREVPVTFWLLTRPTARFERGEVFLFVTPWRAPRAVNQAVNAALAELPDAKISQGIEPIPKEAVPSCQVYKGKVIRFFGDFLSTGEPVCAAVRWSEEADGPRLVGMPFNTRLANDDEDADEIWVRAEVGEELREGELRGKQLCLARGVAMADQLQLNPEPATESGQTAREFLEKIDQHGIEIALYEQASYGHPEDIPLILAVLDRLDTEGAVVHADAVLKSYGQAITPHVAPGFKELERNGHAWKLAVAALGDDQFELAVG